MLANLLSKPTGWQVCKGDIGRMFPSQMFIPFQLPAEELNWTSFKLKWPRAHERKGPGLPLGRRWMLIINFINNENNVVLRHLSPWRKLIVFSWSFDSTVFCSTIRNLTVTHLKMGGDKRLYCFKELLTLK